MLPSLLLIFILITHFNAGMLIGVRGAFMHPSSSRLDCSDSQLSRCISPDNINKFRLISDAEELDSLCGTNINDRLRCIDNYTRNCMDNEQRSHFNKIYSESTMVLQEICADGGEYRREFLKHSPCIKSNQAAHEECSVSYSRSLEDIKNSAKSGVTTNTHVKTLCCSLQEYIRCSKESVAKVCGTGTARFAAGFLDRMVSGLIENHCQNHRIHDGRCKDADDTNGSDSSDRPPTYLILLIIAVAYLLPKL